MTPSPAQAISARDAVLVLWHGAKRWDGPACVRPPREGHYECGPGIYLTTHYSTACKYSRGGGALMRMELDPGLHWLEKSKLDLAMVNDFVKDLPRLRKRREILADLASNAQRMQSHQVDAAVLVNLGVNHRAFAGQIGCEVAKFLAAQGIHASLNAKSGTEEWVVVFDPRVILSVKKVPASSIDSDFDFPGIADQLAARQAVLATRWVESVDGKPKRTLAGGLGLGLAGT